MGGFVPAAALSILQIGLESAHRSRQAAAINVEQAVQTRQRIEEIRRAEAIEGERRRQALNEALASQRARFGAQGIAAGDAGGSAAAVLSGLSAVADRRAREDQDLALLRMQGLQDRLAVSRKRNLLEASQPTYAAALSLLQRTARRYPLLDLS